jgi:DNA polymerase III sliding clamp (beta) subunit (PCNA family)
MSATDHVVWVSQAIPATVKTAGEVCVDAGLLDGIAQSLSEGEVRLSLKKRLTITQSGKRRSLPPIIGDEFPEEPTPKFKTNWKQPVQSFIYRSEQVGFAASQDMSRPMLMGVNMDMANQLMVGADGFRMAIFKTDFGEAELSPTFTTRFVQEVKRSGMGGDISISVSENWIRGLSEDELTVVWAKGLVGAYPAEAAQITKAMIEKEGTILEIEKAGLVQSLGLACLYAERARTSSEDAVLYLVADKGKIRVEMLIPNIAELKDKLPGKAEGDLLVKLDPRYFLEIVDHVDADTVHVRFFDAKKPILITDPNSPDWASVLTQMVVREAPKTPVQKVVEKYTEPDPEPEEEKIVEGDF